MSSPHGQVPVDASPLATRTPICAAPFVAMEFDAFGDVQACCANALYPLGNVTTSSLLEIWHGPRAQALRSALAAGDMSLGCSICRHRLTHGHGDLALSYYDNFPLPDGPVEWPYSLQFSLHNTCNLECVMCGADRSSRIRTRRSGLDPLPHVYGPRFFEEIEPFLANCGAVDLSGGEPFLIPEHRQIWDLLIAMDHRPLCSLTTNGTIWNSTVERVLDHLDTHVAVSIDGITKATFESIRVGADFETVMVNLDRFLAYTKERGTILTMSWSLVRGNWHELGAAMRFADERGIQVKVNTVIEPEFGVQQLPTDELASVVESLEAETLLLADDLTLNRAMWEREVARLRAELDHRDVGRLRPRCMEPPRADNAAHVEGMLLSLGTDHVPLDTQVALRVAQEDLLQWDDRSVIGSLELASDGTISEVRVDEVLPSFDPQRPPATLSDLFQHVETALDAQLWIAEEVDEGDRVAVSLWFGRSVRDKSGMLVRAFGVPNGAGASIVLMSDRTLLPGAETRVTLSSQLRIDADAAG